jgi:hypothetical protein
MQDRTHLARRLAAAEACGALRRQFGPYAVRFADSPLYPTTAAWRALDTGRVHGPETRGDVQRRSPLYPSMRDAWGDAR